MELTGAAQRAIRLIQAREAVAPWEDLPPRAYQENWRIVPRFSLATGAHFWQPQERVIGGDWLDGPLFPTPRGARMHIIQTERPPVKEGPTAFVVPASRQARHRQPTAYKETPQ
jgi:hypothetical protein